MEKSIFKLYLFYIHVLLFLNSLFKKWNPRFNVKVLNKEKNKNDVCVA